MLPKPGLRE
jgi:hypothetical protein